MTTGKEETIVPNEIFNVMRALVNKLEGLAAYDKYAKDGDKGVWQSLKAQDEGAVRQLLQQLQQFMQQGELKTT